MPHLHSENNTLAPPPPAPHGPRLPSSNAYSYSRSRSPSPVTPIIESYHRGSENIGAFELPVEIDTLHIHHNLHGRQSYDSYIGVSEGQTPIKPSAKALGKRKVVEEDASERMS